MSEKTVENLEEMQEKELEKMQEMQEEVMGMYDVRGIQNYIYRTNKIRDAIGASAIVEHIIDEALNYAVQSLKGGVYPDIECDLDWFDSKGGLKYQDIKNRGKKNYVQVLYIGGGNAYVVFSSGHLALAATKFMSRYIIDKTYSLQLASAFVKKTDDYSKNYKELNRRMIMTKEIMCDSKPLGALPVMDVEIKTGYPLTSRIYFKDKYENVGTETRLKVNVNDVVRKELEENEKILDNYVTKKGTDSTLAVVHIDGNNMGMRIRKMTENIHSYPEAVKKMRDISYQINFSYKEVFDSMKKNFEEDKDFRQEGKDNKYFIMKIITAGDDITYVCNAAIALATVEYFARQISQRSMNKENPDHPEYKFSVCAGVAYIGSHFPFNVGYEVAEECCASAKEIAKKDENKESGKETGCDMIGNWVDFQICKNVKALDFKRMRKNEYITASGENLLRRPYFIYVDEESEVFKSLNQSERSFNRLKKDYAQIMKREIPASFLKEIRNTYPQGRSQLLILNSFLKSRNNQIAEDEEMYFEDGNTAMYYDLMEIMDYCAGLNETETMDHCAGIGETEETEE